MWSWRLFSETLSPIRQHWSVILEPSARHWQQNLGRFIDPFMHSFIHLFLPFLQLEHGNTLHTWTYSMQVTKDVSSTDGIFCSRFQHTLFSFTYGDFSRRNRIFMCESCNCRCLESEHNAAMWSEVRKASINLVDVCMICVYLSQMLSIRHILVKIWLLMPLVKVGIVVHCIHKTQCESKISRLRFSDIFPKRYGILVQILHAYYMFLSMVDCKFLFSYLQLRWSYTILSATTQFTSYA